jgi:hypothetical protein
MGTLKGRGYKPMGLVSDKPGNDIGMLQTQLRHREGDKPDALGWKPCHWTRTLKAAMVKARRAWKYAQPRCITFLKWQTTVSIASTVSTSMRACYSPRGQSLRLAGSPSAA